MTKVREDISFMVEPGHEDSALHADRYRNIARRCGASRVLAYLLCCSVRVLQPGDLMGRVCRYHVQNKRITRSAIQSVLLRRHSTATIGWKKFSKRPSSHDCICTPDGWSRRSEAFSLESHGERMVIYVM